MSWVWYMGALGSGTQQYAMAADRGSYALVGNDAGSHLVADIGSYALTGNAAGLDYGRVVSASVGSYSVTGYAIGVFVKGVRMSVERGDYKLSGVNALLEHTTIPIKDPVAYVEDAWVQPENEGNLDAELEWEDG